MADYFVILKRAVDAIPGAGREQRQAIYDKARKALLAQLQNMDPPLAASEISKQRMALEEAVRSVERELDLAAKASEGDDAQSEAKAPEVAVEPVSKASDKSEAVAKPAAKTAEMKSPAPAPKVVSASSDDKPEVAVSKTASTAASTEQPDGKTEAKPEAKTEDPVVSRAGPDVLKHAVRDANALGDATNAAVKSAKDAAEAVGEGREDKKAQRIEPTLGGARVAPVEKKIEPDLKPTKTEPTFAEALEEVEEPKSRFGLVAGLLLLAGLLGGSGYLLYQNRDAFMGDSASSSDVAPDKPVAANGGERSTQDVQPAKSGETSIPAKQVRTVDVTPPAVDPTRVAPNPSASEVAPGAPVTPQPDGQAGETVAGLPSDGEAATASEASGVKVAQRSILYEEEGPNGEPGTANPGDVLWVLEGDGTDAKIIVSAKIPNQNVTYSLKISKNKDAELPASHLIEISAERAQPDDKRQITKIPGLILKPTEQSRGEGLVGAAIKISDNLHWIALTAGEKELKYNMELLTLRSWIDIPIQYNSGVRAILTLEKGTVGDQVIEDALKAWGDG